MAAVLMVLVACAAISHFGSSFAAQNECKVKGQGKLTKFSGEKVSIKLPCKYQAAIMSCQGYRIEVTPGQALDTKGRYFTDSVWITVLKEGTNFYWRGRASTKRAQRYFSNMDKKEPFRTKEATLEGAPFDVQMTADDDAFSLTLKMNDATWRVDVFAYDEGDKMRRDNVGVRMYCPAGATFPLEAGYPTTVCGNSTDSDVLKERKRLLQMDSLTLTLMYDLLDNPEVKQNNPQCETAMRVFQKSCPADLKSEVVKTCSNILTNKRIIRCLIGYNIEPMDTFVYCLKYLCEGSGESCALLNEALEGCPNVNLSLPNNGECPIMGAATSAK